jgi:predicted alpha/beta hydrolase
MCLTPGYIKPGHDDPPPASFLAFQGDMMVLSFTDDTIMPKAAVDALHRNFLSASVTARHVSPAEMDMTSTGHFGAFRPGSPKLWGMIADWLAGQRAR